MNEQRIEKLDKLVKTAEEKKERTYTIRWRGENLHLPVIRVDASFLRYRLESGRTRREQKAYLEANPQLPRNLFDDPESEVAQNAQGAILLKMVNDGGLRSDLLREGQRQPAIITYDGYVLNGNRRLAALRKEDEQWVDCVVLPKDATRKDLYELELDLQMARETKAEYHWVNELLHIRYGVEELKEKTSVVAQKMRKDENDIKTKLRMLMLVDLYLDWLNKSQQYHLVKGEEQAFTELEKYTKKIKETDKQELFRKEVFSIITDPPSEGRIYDHIGKLYKHFIKIQAKIGQEIGEPIRVVEVEGTKKENSKQVPPSTDPMKALAEIKTITEEIPIPTCVTNLFDTPSTAKKHGQKLVDAIKDAHEEYQDKKNRRAVYDAVKTAHSKLQGITIDSTTSDIEAIYNNLHEIIRIAQDLVKSAEKYRERRRR